MTGASTGLIVALDHPSLSEAERVARQIGSRVDAFKVGLTLFAGYGPRAVESISAYGPVFCDLKLHDIPHQVALASAKLARLGVWMFTVHSSGGGKMITAAVEAAHGAQARPMVAAVTVLTSLSSADLSEVGQGPDVAGQVHRLGDIAVRAGADALVCSPLEAEGLRSSFAGKLKLVVPGVRPAGSDLGDQARIMTPAQAAKAGASYVVVGRPVTDSPDPAAAADRIIEELRAAQLADR